MEFRDVFLNEPQYVHYVLSQGYRLKDPSMKSFKKFIRFMRMGTIAKQLGDKLSEIDNTALVHMIRLRRLSHVVEWRWGYNARCYKV